MIIQDVTDDSKCCCSCKHNLRTTEDNIHVTCNCGWDGHYIGYVENFEKVCDRWEETNGGKSIL